jgi:DNA-directed RNA polymerase III subunit RPC4
MTASGPFAMGPTQAGSSAWHGGARISSATPTAPRGLVDAAALGANLTKTGAPTLKKERGGARHTDDDNDDKDAARTGADDENGEYSDPDEGVEIIDMRNVHAMDWMAPESLKWESAREKSKKKNAAKVKKEEGVRCRSRGKVRASFSSLFFVGISDDDSISLNS